MARRPRFSSDPDFPVMQKTVNTFAEIKDVVASMSLTNSPSCISANGKQRDKKSYYINIKNEGDKYTKLEHELSHLVFNSPIRRLNSCISMMINGSELAKVKKEFERDGKTIDLQQAKTSIVKSCFNFIEDERVESNWSKIYEGSKANFEEQKRQAGINMGFEKINDPINALMASRFGRDDLLEGTPYENVGKYLRDVRETSAKGSIAVTKRYIDEYVTPWIKANADQLLQPPPEDESEKKCDSRELPIRTDNGKKKEQDEKEDEDDMTKASDFDNDLNDPEQGEDGDSDSKSEGKPKDKPSKGKSSGSDSKDSEPSEPESGDSKSDKGESKGDEPKTDSKDFEDLDGEFEKFEKDMEDRIKSREEYLKILEEFNKKKEQAEQNIYSLIDTANDVLKASDHESFEEKDMMELKTVRDVLSDYTEAISDSKSDFQEEARTIKDVVYGTSKSASGTLLHPMDKNEIEIISRPRGQFKPDMALARTLNQQFKQIRAKYSDTLDLAGMECDIDEYIQDKLNLRQRMFWTDEKYETGLAISVGIDCSGSMDGADLQTARDFCATLYKSLEGIEGIDLTIVPWSTPNGTSGLAITEIKKYEDVAHITQKSNYIQNANHTAHQYLEDIVRKSKAEKKLVIMLTDGLPAFNPSGREEGYSYEDMINATTKAVQQARKRGTIVFGIFLGVPGSSNDQNMERMYGKDYMCVESMDDARQQIIKVFKTNVISQLRSV